MNPTNNVKGSFRDPSGFLFYQEDKLCRQINKIYQSDYAMLMESGLYQELAKENLIVQHKETEKSFLDTEPGYKVICPQLIAPITYPYEWCFSQLKDAALLTLKIQKTALKYKMTLKDASAYNIQFTKGSPVFIDTLSFTKHQEGEPWIAYKQFCQHFLAPLSLMAYKDVRLSLLLREFIDGIPLDLASSLLPKKTYFSLGLTSHIHIHAKAQTHYKATGLKTNKRKMNLSGLLGLIDNLESTVKKLKFTFPDTAWSDYYTDTNYTKEGFEHKKQIIQSLTDKKPSSTLLDLGANTGCFSRCVSNKDTAIISSDMDPVAVEKNYLQCKTEKTEQILPLLINLDNPSPGLGWSLEERDSFLKRFQADTVMALALIHHLAIANNIPLNSIAGFFHKLCKQLIIEFVPKEDSQVQRLLASREDIFSNYTQKDFENSFSSYFDICESIPVKESKRTIYYMKA